MLICSTVIFRHVTLNNVSSLLSDATYYNALQLVDSLQTYITCNMEAIMESRFLDSMQSELIEGLSGFVRKRQAEMSPVMRLNMMVEDAMRRNTEWLGLQDIPQPLVRNQRLMKESPKLCPVRLSKAALPRHASGPIASPLSSPPPASLTKLDRPKLAQGDEIFTMEDEAVEAIPVLNIGQPRMPPSEFTVPTTAWKSTSAQDSPRYVSPAVTCYDALAKNFTRVDMKVIMAEEETSKPMAGAPSGTLGARVVDFKAVDQVGASSSKSSQKLPQRERRMVQSRTLETFFDPPRQVSNSGLPWRLPAPPASTSASPVSAHVPQVLQLSTATVRMDGLLRSPSSGDSHMRVSKLQSTTPAPIIQAPNHVLRMHSPATPESSLSGTVRRSAPCVPRYSVACACPLTVLDSDAPAWTNAKLQATVAAPTAHVPIGLSFAAIQQQQRDQDQDQDPKGKSLREIQQEEQALREEEDFLRWWTTEEQRLKAEAEMEVAHVLMVDSGSSNKRLRGTRRGGPAGRAGGSRRRGGNLRGGNSAH